jgi:hypothetical protein
MQGRKTGGRKKGTPNKATADVRALCTQLLTDPAYVANFTERLHAGKLAPHVEALLWHYAYGKPVEHLEVGGEDGRPVEVRFVLVDGAS